MSKYSEAGKGSTTKLKQKKKFDENFDQIFGKKEEYFDSDDESNSWDEDRIDIIGQNGATGEHYIKWLYIRSNNCLAAWKDHAKCGHQIKTKGFIVKNIDAYGFGKKCVGIKDIVELIEKM